MALATDKDILRVAHALYREQFRAFAYRAFEIVNPGEKIEWNWHLDCLCEALQSVYRGEIQRLVINMPPRALKSFLCSIAFPAWVLGKDPQEKIMVASHTIRPLATKLSNDCRRLVESDWYKSVFPQTRLIKSTETEFYTSENGHRLAFGVTGPTGLGCNYAIVDDLNKPDEALSDTIRTSTNNWLDNTFMSRFNDYRTGKTIVVMQRVHENDVTGHLLEKGGYTHIKLPAEFEEKPVIKIGDKTFTPPHDRLLFPARLPQDILDQKRVDLGDYAYAGQFLQEPVPIGGGMFKDSWPRYYDPKDFNPATCNVYILCDPANSKKKNSDWTVYQVVGLAPDNNYYLLDMVRDKLNPTERINTLFDLHKKWNEKCGKPPRVGMEQYGLMSDNHYVLEKQKQESYRFDIRPLGGIGSKVDRIARLIPYMQSGRWYFPTAINYVDSNKILYELVSEMVKGEMLTFPVSKHDDCLDALSRIYDTDLEATFPRFVSKRAAPVRQQDWMDF